MNDQNEPKRWRVVFAGTPAYAVPSLDAMLTLANVDVVGVLTQKPKPHGRGLAEQVSAVASRAQELGLFTMTPDSVRTPEVQATIRGLHADVAVVVAYGKIIPPILLNAIPKGWVNAHASLLPRWRGASPIQHAILAGDTETGVCLMQLEPGMDTGPVFASATMPIVHTDTTASLAPKLAMLSAQLLAHDFLPYLRGERILSPQPAVGVLTAPKIESSAGVIQWSEPARNIERAIRAFTPWPSARTNFGKMQLKIVSASVAEGTARPGFVAAHPRGCSVGTGNGLLILEQVQPAGKKPMDVHAFLRGHPELLGATLA